MVRRLALVATVLTLAGVPLDPAAQPMPRVGLIQWGECTEAGLAGSFGSFFTGLAELGRVVTIECRSAGRSYPGLADAAALLVAAGVDVLVANSQPGASAARKASATLPIVAIMSGDPVGAGFAQSLAAPGGGVTGLTYYATEPTAKRLELLRELLPGLATVGVLANPAVADLPFEADTAAAAGRLGLALVVEQVATPADLAGAFARLAAAPVEAVFVLPDLMLAAESRQIAELALRHGLPSMAWGGWFTAAGCLMAYSTDYAALAHRLADDVDRVLAGTPPGELPIEQPPTFVLSVNLLTAEALGIEVPASLLVLADEVIE